jgi:hypothetical protein
MENWKILIARERLASSVILSRVDGEGPYEKQQPRISSKGSSPSSRLRMTDAT